MRLPASYLKLDPRVIPVRLRTLWRTRVASGKKLLLSRKYYRTRFAGETLFVLLLPLPSAPFTPSLSLSFRQRTDIGRDSTHGEKPFDC